MAEEQERERPAQAPARVVGEEVAKEGEHREAEADGERAGRAEEAEVGQLPRLLDEVERDAEAEEEHRESDAEAAALAGGHAQVRLGGGRLQRRQLLVPGGELPLHGLHVVAPPVRLRLLHVRDQHAGGARIARRHRPVHPELEHLLEPLARGGALRPDP